MIFKKYNVYLIKNLSKYLFISIFLLSNVVWLTRSISYFNYITNYGLSLTDFIKIMSSILPDILVLIIPVCSSIATILYYTKISQNNELVILRNSGLNKKGLIIAPFITGLMACVFSYFIMFNLIPRANFAFERAIDLLKKNFANVLLNSGDFRNFDNFKIYSNNRDGNRMKSLIIFVNDDKNDNKLIYSESGELIDNNFLKLSNGSIYLLDKNDNKIKTEALFFYEYIINLGDFFLSKKITKTSNNNKFVKVNDLIRIKNKSLENISEILYKFMNPLLSLILSLLSVVIILNFSFSRYENNIFSMLVFILDLIIFAIFTYSFFLAKKKIFGLYIMIASVLIPVIYIIIDLIKDDRKVFAD